MKSFPALRILLLCFAVLCAFLACAGCTNSGNEGSIVPPNQESLPFTRPEISPSITRPQFVSGSGATAPVPSVTIDEAMYEDLQEIKDTLYALSEEWDLSAMDCSQTTCTGSFVNVNGDTLTITATIYQTVDAATSAYEQQKQKGSSYRQLEVDVGDEAYAWQYRTTSELGFRKSNLLVIIHYEVAGGIAGIGEIKSIASIAAGNL
ncbi:MAG TPA: hypothetical protein VMW63_06905 [Methanoregulaceae archaeon]|nr:hypothetical protein [Methanoregulaceae archaeon]